MAEKTRLGRLLEVEYLDNLTDVKIVEFELFTEGPNRDPRLIIPKTLDLSSPFAIFLLFWTEEI